jgi:hypothetical protein
MPHITLTEKPHRVAALLLAICAVAIPASASADGTHSSISAITGGSGESSQTATELGPPVPTAPDALPAPDTYLAQHVSGASNGSAGAVDAAAPLLSGYSSVNAINGANAAEPTAVVDSSTVSSDGFDWGDALIGALLISGLALMALTARTVVRHRRATAHSGA